MTKFAILDRLVEEGNGFLQTSKALESNVSKVTLAKYITARHLERVAHGVYLAEYAWPDNYYLLYLRSSRIVFSHKSALYLHCLVDREPSITTVTVPKNYNSTHITKKDVRVIHTKTEWYEMGISFVKTGYGNEVPVYDKERTICDMIRCKKEIEIQTFQTALKEYMNGQDKRLGNLIDYARILGVEKEVRTYTEILL